MTTRNDTPTEAIARELVAYLESTADDGYIDTGIVLDYAWQLRTALSNTNQEES